MKKINRPVNLSKGKKDDSDSDLSILIEELIRFVPMWIFIIAMVCLCIYVGELSHIASNESKIHTVTETADNAVISEDRREDNESLLWFVLYNYYNSLLGSY